jgi:hypothetical protein
MPRALKRLLIIAVVLLAILLPRLGCLVAPGGCRDRHFDAVVHDALFCQECIAGEIDSLVAYGDFAVPRLRSEMRGPTPDDFAAHARLIDAQWRLIRTRRLNKLPAALADDSTRLARQSAEALGTSYQKRVLRVLDRIGTPSARQAIRDAYGADSTAGRTLLHAGARILADSLRHP